MELRVVGAGLPRTGTTSLKSMLEQLLDGRCYHMRECYANADHDGPLWIDALDGRLDALDEVLRDCVAAVDWPASIFWRELAERHPDALVILSHRGSPTTWWQSADATVWEVMRGIRDGTTEEHVAGMHERMRNRAGFDHDLEAPAAQARYESHFDEVVAAIPADRLLLWDPADGWEPLCERLGVPVPAEPPAHDNTSASFQARHRSRDS